MEKIYKDRNDIASYNYKPNHEYDFIPTDGESIWKKHLKNLKVDPTLQYYLHNPIKYRLNNEGFRTPDNFNNTDEGNVFLGCSHTFGIGHHLENTWSYKFNQKIGGKFWNLSIPGTGVASHFRLLLGYYKELNIKNIFHYAPKYPRYEFIENGRPQNYIINDYYEGWEGKFGSLMMDSLLTDEQCEFNWVSYTRAVKGLADEIGCNYYLIEGDNGWHGMDDDSLRARDLLHHTSLYHHKVYLDFLNLYDPSLINEEENKNPIFDIGNYIKSQKISIL